MIKTAPLIDQEERACAQSFRESLTDKGSWTIGLGGKRCYCDGSPSEARLPDEGIAEGL